MKKKSSSEIESNFSPKTIRFMRQIKKNNDREWFEAHREDYETFVKKPGQALVSKIIRDLRKAGYVTQGKDLKKIPAGFDPKHPNAEFLLHNGLFVTIETDLLAVFYTPRFSGEVLKRLKPCLPFFKWMREMMREAPKDLNSFFRTTSEQVKARKFDTDSFDLRE